MVCIAHVLGLAGCCGVVRCRCCQVSVFYLAVVQRGRLTCGVVLLPSAYLQNEHVFFFFFLSLSPAAALEKGQSSECSLNNFAFTLHTRPPTSNTSSQAGWLDQCLSNSSVSRVFGLPPSTTAVFSTQDRGYLKKKNWKSDATQSNLIGTQDRG